MLLLVLCAEHASTFSHIDVMVKVCRSVSIYIYACMSVIDISCIFDQLVRTFVYDGRTCHAHVTTASVVASVHDIEDGQRPWGRFVCMRTTLYRHTVQVCPTYNTDCI